MIRILSLQRRYTMIDRSESNIFPWPKGAYIRNKAYVYINTSNKYVPPSRKKIKGTRGYTDHDSTCIGVTIDPSDLNKKMLYANRAYRAKLSAAEAPDSKENVGKADTVSLE